MAELKRWITVTALALERAANAYPPRPVPQPR
jgi:hypothetical protein